MGPGHKKLALLLGVREVVSEGPWLICHWWYVTSVSFCSPRSCPSESAKMACNVMPPKVRLPGGNKLPDVLIKLDRVWHESLAAR